MEELIGHVAVDSGQIMIADPCYINTDFVKEFDPGQLGESDESPTQDKYEMDYDGCCNATLSKRGFGQLGNEYTDKLGLACRTLWGDGIYPVLAEMVDGRVKSIRIDFDWSDPDENTCGYCGENLDWDCYCGEEEVA